MCIPEKNEHRDDAGKEPRPRRVRRMPEKRANNLDGRIWTRYSLSLWSDIAKTREEKALKHPALFPEMLAGRLIECFTATATATVLDPFAGTGSTLLAAARLGRQGIGIELSPEYAAVARERIAALPPEAPPPQLHQANAMSLSEILAPETVDLVVTSPPYWNILSGRRSADRRATRDYENAASDDLGKIEEYEPFLQALGAVFSQVYTVLRPGGYCCTVVMDLRKGSRLYPFHSDLATELGHRGFLYDDLIIWDRHSEYNCLRPLGYPAVFRINKVHEFILIFKKPDSTRKE